MVRKKGFFGLHVEDARNLSKLIPLSTVDVTITSPPYYKLKDYGGLKGEIGREHTYQEYLENLKHVFEDCYKVTKNTGSLWAVVDTFKENGKLKLLPFDVAREIEKSGWILRDVIIWNKTKTLPWSKNGHLRRIFEYILFFTKTETPRFKYYVDRIREKPEQKSWGGWIKYPERYNPRGKVPVNIWEFPIPTQGSWGKGYIHHFCPFPAKLVERILLLTTNRGDTVLDPFAGSGIVLAQAHIMKRKYIGFELNPRYVKMVHEQVLPTIKKEAEPYEKTLTELKNARKKLETRIRKLRLLKYSRELLKSLHNNGCLDEFKPPINTMVVISDAFKRSKMPMFEDIYLVLDEKVNKGEILNEILSLSKNPPLSKFGILAKFHILETWGPVLDAVKGKRMWLYSGGGPMSKCKPIKLDNWRISSYKSEWEEEFKKSTISSNIKI